MGNLLQYTDKSKTIDNKLQALISQINYQYRNGEIKTETEYYYRIKSALNSFYDSLTKPMFKFRPAVSTPMSSEYNAMINESYKDIEYIIKDCEALEAFISQSFTDAQLSRTMINNQLNYLTNKANNLKQTIENTNTNDNIIFSDSFNDLDLIGNSKSDKACTINTFEGILTLKTVNITNNVVQSINIDNTSNGFPGNTHCVDTLNNDIHYLGQDELHIDPYTMIDQNKDTWFEFELFSISNIIKKNCNSYGFEYEEGISWINNNDNLILKLTLNLANNSICSWISLLPYIAESKGATSCKLIKCDVISASNNVYTIAINQAFDKTLCFAFPSQAISKVELTFMQDTKYLTKIGHNYFTNINTSSMSIYQNFDNTDGFTRIDGPKPNLGLLGLKYNPEDQWISYMDETTTIPSDKYIKSNLFTLPESTIERKSNVEIIDAYRYLIGIRDIKIPSCTFEEESEYISKVFTTEENITSVSLETSEYVPDENLDLLKYYISLDGGSTWYPITPMQRPYNGIYKYYINNDSIENLLTNNSDYFKAQNISVLTDTKQIQLKISMKRPIENDYITPIVYSYQLKLTTGGESIEY